MTHNFDTHQGKIIPAKPITGSLAEAIKSVMKVANPENVKIKPKKIADMSDDEIKAMKDNLHKWDAKSKVSPGIAGRPDLYKDGRQAIGKPVSMG